MKINRRSFLKYFISGGVASSVTLISLNSLTNNSILNSASAKTNKTTQSTNSNKYPNPNNPDKAWGMIIDLNKCVGCNYADDEEAPCTAACRTMHNVPPDQSWIKVEKTNDNHFSDSYFFPRLCMQCENPPCVAVCPVGASLRRSDGDGLVLIDNTICIGCRLCMAGCPYDIRHFNWLEYDEPNKAAATKHSPMFYTRHDRGTVGKCDFCGHLAYNDKKPACVGACQEGALYYGNLKENAVTNNQEETLNVRKTLSDKGGYRFKEELGTNPRVFYLPKRK